MRCDDPARVQRDVRDARLNGGAFAWPPRRDGWVKLRRALPNFFLPTKVNRSELNGLSPHRKRCSKAALVALIRFPSEMTLAQRRKRTVVRRVALVDSRKTTVVWRPALVVYPGATVACREALVVSHELTDICGEALVDRQPALVISRQAIVGGEKAIVFSRMTIVISQKSAAVQPAPRFQQVVKATIAGVWRRSTLSTQHSTLNQFVLRRRHCRTTPCRRSRARFRGKP